MSSSAKAEIGKRLMAERLRLGLDTAQLAAKARLSESEIVRLEDGGRIVYGEVAKRLVEAGIDLVFVTSGFARLAIPEGHEMDPDDIAAAAQILRAFACASPASRPLLVAQVLLATSFER